jgi:quercetin dioxygenase-like cupin family protein
MSAETETVTETVAVAFVQVSCRDFNASLSFFTSPPLGFLVESIFPADDPCEAALVGHGLKLLLVKDGKDDATTICVQLCERSDSEVLSKSCDFSGPNGTRVRLLPPELTEMVRPALKETVVVSHLQGEGEGEGEETDTVWSVGRAGMRYRDLIPCRLGGRYIASHIHIPRGGPVPDYCHYHHIHFQMIFCYKGWVRVVYEGQGEPFIMKAGDCVLQPPKIRHRVLEASDNLEVVEVGSPAVHKTVQDFMITLPTPEVDTDREFGGQKFVRHLQSDRDSNNESDGFKPVLDVWGQPIVETQGRTCVWEARDTGILLATAGIASVRVIRVCRLHAPTQQSNHGEVSSTHTHMSDMLLLFLLKGSLQCDVQTENAQRHILVAGSSVVVPALVPFSISHWSDDVEVLEIQVFK